MGGATILCGDFEGEDKAASPIVSVLDRAFFEAFGAKRRGRLARRIASWLGSRSPVDRDEVELAILEVMYNEEGEIPSSVARLLLPHLLSYQASLLARCGIDNTPEAIRPHMHSSIAAKYGRRPDPGWHLYCLHDLVLACDKSISTGLPLQIVWS